MGGPIAPPEVTKYDLISDPIFIHQVVNTDKNPLCASNRALCRAGASVSKLFIGPPPMDLQFWPGAVVMILIATLTAPLMEEAVRNSQVMTNKRQDRSRRSGLSRWSQHPIGD